MPSKPFRSSVFWTLLWCVNSNEELLLGRERVCKKVNLCNVESATRSFFTYSPWPHFFGSILISSEAAVCCYWSPVRHCGMSCGCDMTYCSNRRRAIWIWSIINMLMVAYFITPYPHFCWDSNQWLNQRSHILQDNQCIFTSIQCPDHRGVLERESSIQKHANHCDFYLHLTTLVPFLVFRNRATKPLSNNS